MRPTLVDVHFISLHPAHWRRLYRNGQDAEKSVSGRYAAAPSPQASLLLPTLVATVTRQSHSSRASYRECRQSPSTAGLCLPNDIVASFVDGCKSSTFTFTFIATLVAQFWSANTFVTPDIEASLSRRVVHPTTNSDSGPVGLCRREYGSPARPLERAFSPPRAAPGFESLVQSRQPSALRPWSQQQDGQGGR
jgi:hypothetical protein